MGLGIRYYVLEGKRALPVRTLKAWAQAFELSNRHVGNTRVGAYWVSTVFLGLDHNFSGKGRPILFETMIFRGKGSDGFGRCGTWEEAEAMHKKAVTHVRKEIREKVND